MWSKILLLLLGRRDSLGKGGDFAWLHKLEQHPSGCETLKERLLLDLPSVLTAGRTFLSFVLTRAECTFKTIIYLALKRHHVWHQINFSGEVIPHKGCHRRENPVFSHQLPDFRWWVGPQEKNGDLHITWSGMGTNIRTVASFLQKTFQTCIRYTMGGVNHFFLVEVDILLWDCSSLSF